MNDIDSNFFETPAGQTIAGARKYLTAARELRYSETWQERPKLLQAPTIHLLAHGVELLFKYPLIAGGMDPDLVRRSFGHDLLKLWHDDANQHLRSSVLERATEAWEEARASNLWPHDNFGRSPPDELVSALHQLDFLHGRDSGFALRYIITPNTSAPRPAFLIDVFGHVAERATMNPGLLLEAWWMPYGIRQ